MRIYNSMYLGMCISNNDPEMRGRVQIFIPHIMPTVYEYGDESTDIEFSAVGDNITGGLRTEIVEKLKAVLPWAESASPIVCSSTPGALIPGTNQAVATPTSYPVPSNPAGPVTLSIPNPSGANVSNLAPGFASRLESFYQEAIRLAPPYNITLGGPRSAFRSSVDQVALFAKSGGSGSVARPGSSAHEYGIAVDLKITGPGVSITEISVDASRNRRNYDTEEFRALLGKHGLHQPLHPAYNSNPRSMEHWHIEPIETPKAGGARGRDKFLDVQKALQGTQTPSVSSTESTAPAQPPIPAAQATRGEPLSSAPPSNILPNGNTLSTINAVSVFGWLANGFNKAANGSQYPNVIRDSMDNQQFALGGVNVAPTFNPQTGAVENYGTVGASLNPGTSAEFLSKKFPGEYFPKSYSDYLRYLSPGPPSERERRRARLLNHYRNLRVRVNVSDPTGSTRTSAAFPIVDIGPADGLENRVDLTYGAWLTVAKPSEVTMNGFGIGKGVNRYKVSAEIYYGGDPKLGTDLANSITTTSTTNPHGPVNYIDTNDRPRGTFAIPAPGAMLWVFFREGNPQFPVFFATSFSQKEWAASGVYNSGGAQTYTNSGAGQMISTDILTPEGVTHSAFTVGGGDTGSNLSFAPDHTSLYSAMSFRQDTMHDSFHVIGGNHEQKVYGESSHTVFGDRIRRVGTFTDEAYEAANQLWAQVKETNDTLAQPS